MAGYYKVGDSVNELSGQKRHGTVAMISLVSNDEVYVKWDGDFHMQCVKIAEIDKEK